MQKIFILGGSHLQVALLKAAKALDYEVFLFDRDEFCAGKSLCDRFFHVDIVNHRKIYEIARQYHPQCICTIANEVGNVASNVISKALGLTYNPSWTLLATTNKLIMRDVLRKVGLYKRKSCPVEEIKETSRFPCIVKPVVSSASRGVKIVNNESELLKAADLSKSISRNKQVMVEDIFEGLQYSVETMSFNGLHQVIGITEEYIDADGELLESQDMMPARIPSAKKEIIEKSSIKALNALGVQYGAGHIELLMNKNSDVEVIEVASRLGFARHELLYYSSGIDASSALISCLTGDYEKMLHFLKSEKRLFSMVKVLYEEKDLVFFEKYKNMEEIREHVFMRKDLPTHPPSSMADMIGYYFVQTDSEAVLRKHLLGKCEVNSSRK